MGVLLNTVEIPVNGYKKRKGKEMKRIVKLLMVSAVALLAVCAVPAPAVGRERLLMDFGWKFQLGHLCDMEKDFGYWGGNSESGDHFKTGLPSGPARRDFDDSGWQDIYLPHDWAIGLPFDRNAEPFHAYKKMGRKFPANTVGWYRKSFKIPRSDLGKRH